MSNINSKSPHFGGYYFLQGLKLIFKPGIKRYTLIPILLNIVLYVLLWWYAWGEIQAWVGAWLQSLSNNWSWLAYVLYPVIWLSMVLLTMYTFVIMSLLLASPFFGFLTQALQNQWQGKQAERVSFREILLLVPRSISRELGKIMSFLPWLFAILLCYIIPGVNLFTGFFWVLFLSWFNLVQFADYIFDNNSISFNQMKVVLKQNKVLSLSFGFTVTIFMMVPLLNILVIPAAVAGAALMYWENFQAEK